MDANLCRDAFGNPASSSVDPKTLFEGSIIQQSVDGGLNAFGINSFQASSSPGLYTFSYRASIASTWDIALYVGPVEVPVIPGVLYVAPGDAFAVVIGDDAGLSGGVAGTPGNFTIVVKDE